MCQQLVDLIARRSDKSLHDVAPHDAKQLQQFIKEDGQRDISAGTLQIALDNGQAGTLAYGCANMESGFLLGLAYASAHGAPPWIDALFPPPTLFDDALHEIQGVPLQSKVKCKE